MVEEKESGALIIAKDLTGLSEPLKKLLDMIQRGCGILYRPRAIRQEGKALIQVETARITAIAQAKADAKKILADANADIRQRAEARLIHQEIGRQQNIDNVVEAAIKHTPDDCSQVSEDPVDDDWLNRFFGIVGEISNEMMQDVWGRVLAGQTAKPRTYSLRALETLKNMNQREAEIFQRACNLAMKGPTRGGIIKLSSKFHLNDYGLAYDDILLLRAAGVLHDSDQLTLKYDAPERKVYLDYNTIVVRVSHPEETAFRFPSIVFTPAGVELMSLTQPEPDMRYLKDLAEHLKRDDYEVKRVTKGSGAVGTSYELDERDEGVDI